jgi:hypothetical protein
LREKNEVDIYWIWKYKFELRHNLHLY